MSQRDYLSPLVWERPPQGELGRVDEETSGTPGCRRRSQLKRSGGRKKRSGELHRIVSAQL